MRINKEKLDCGFEVYEVLNDEGDLVHVAASYAEAEDFEGDDPMDSYDYICAMERISRKIF